MTEFPVKTVADLERWREVQENLRYLLAADLDREAAESAWSVGWKWSPVQELLQFVTGIETFYYLLMDAPDPMRALLEIMHERNLEGLRLGLQAHPRASVLRLIENTSSQAISPAWYQELTVPHVADYVALAHTHHMTCVVHMCGTLTALYDGIEKTGMDGIHSVTPPPLGDSTYMDVRRRFGDDFIILGRFNAQLFTDRSATDILATLKEMIPPDLVCTPFALWITPDEIPPSETDTYALTEALATWNRANGFCNV